MQRIIGHPCSNHGCQSEQFFSQKLYHLRPFPDVLARQNCRARPSGFINKHRGTRARSPFVATTRPLNRGWEGMAERRSRPFYKRARWPRATAQFRGRLNRISRAQIRAPRNLIHHVQQNRIQSPSRGWSYRSRRDPGKRTQVSYARRCIQFYRCISMSRNAEASEQWQYFPRTW